MQYPLWCKDPAKFLPPYDISQLLLPQCFLEFRELKCEKVNDERVVQVMKQTIQVLRCQIDVGVGREDVANFLKLHTIARNENWSSSVQHKYHLFCKMLTKLSRWHGQLITSESFWTSWLVVVGDDRVLKTFCSKAHMHVCHGALPSHRGFRVQIWQNL